MTFSTFLGYLDLSQKPTELFLVGFSLLVLFFWYFATELEKRKRNIGSVLVCGLVLLCFLGVMPPKERLKGGVDIEGGVAFTLRVQPGIDVDGNELQVTPEAVEQAIEVLRRRLNPDNNKDLFITGQGIDRIVVQMPGITEEEANETETVIEETVRLELRAVHPQSDTLAGLEGKAPPGYQKFTYTRQNRFKEEVSSPVLLSRRIGLDGSFIQEAYPDITQDLVQIRLNSEGGDRMENFTGKMTRGQDAIAVVLDGVVKSVATVQQVPLTDEFSITGLDSTEEARSLARVLNNPLKNPLLVEEKRQVSATLGAETVKQGVNAGLVGLALTILFVLLYYRFAGTIAIVALGINIILLFGMMAMMGFTFTLPGIAGIILTIGVAVDANVLIFERLREELGAGKSVKTAISSAFEKAFSAIFDANITTLITATILFWRASDTVKGFAITLTIGILASMFSALLAVRVMFWWFTDAGMVKKLSFMDLVPKRAIDFLSKRTIAFGLSGVLILASIGGAIVKKDSALGVDFTGGSLIRFSVGDDKVAASEASKVLDAVELSKEAFVQEETVAGSGELLTVRAATDDVDTIRDTLKEQIPALANKKVSIDTVSASLGDAFLTNSLIALGIGLVAILVYITVRFEFSFALGAFVAIFHDLIISIGIVLLLGGELSLIHVGAFLTIAGYSINDTIVVFDRIREDLLTKRGDIKSIMNAAISATLSRTIITSLTTFVSVVVLYLLGGAGLADFSLAIMIGVVVGTYSSIFVASPVVYLWAKMNGTNLRKEVLDRQIEAEVDPDSLDAKA